jgi:hypothetical protein
MPLNWNFPAKIGPRNREQVSVISDDAIFIIAEGWQSKLLQGPEEQVADLRADAPNTLESNQIPWR